MTVRFIVCIPLKHKHEANVVKTYCSYAIQNLFFYLSQSPETMKVKKMNVLWLIDENRRIVLKFSSTTVCY